MAHDFGTRIADLSYAITITLAMRPVGAFIFGLLGDRFGRRIPLMIDIIFYSLMELLTAFSPNYTWLLIFRALYGIGMAENGDLARRWQWKPCQLPRVDCSREFYNKVMRLVICWRPLRIGSYFH